ncbi:MAG TPA: hypothetical protein VJ723_04015, partial [Candidatus Angelobacter sp.]|nr:hypothetical protein [Candidatus Angelobacter sp.]
KHVFLLFCFLRMEDVESLATAISTHDTPGQVQHSALSPETSGPGQEGDRMVWVGNGRIGRRIRFAPGLSAEC